MYQTLHLKSVVSLILMSLVIASGSVLTSSSHAQGTPTPEAIQKLKEEAAKGDSISMNRLGVAYSKGYGGLAIDKATALGWYLKAAKLGNIQAMYNAGVLYEQGLGTVQDLSKAKAWYEKAVQGGHAKAKERLEKLSTAATQSSPRKEAAVPNARSTRNENSILAEKIRSCRAACQARLEECVISYKSAANQVCGMPNAICHSGCDKLTATKAEPEKQTSSPPLNKPNSHPSASPDRQSDLLANMASSIGGARLVECLLESGFVYVKTKVTDEQTKKQSDFSNWTFKAYTELTKRYPNQHEIEAISKAYPRMNRNPTVDEKLMTMAQCGGDKRILPLMQAVANNRPYP